MNNAILFFYGISVYDVKKVKTNYYFSYLNSNYVVYLYERDLNDSIFLYNLNSELFYRGSDCYEIILTKDSNIVFEYEKKYYVLMKIPNISDRTINYNDILNFNYLVDLRRYSKLDKSNWNRLWSNKIDFIEYQFNQMDNKYSIVDDYIDYYIGLWENAISYCNNINYNDTRYITHKRIEVDMSLLDFLNPLNFVVDYKERDYGDYIKSFILKKNYSFNTFDKLLSHSDRNSLIMIICRILFPSYFFDIYEDIVVDNRNEGEILDVVVKSNNILYLLKHIFIKYNYLNIPYIDWIKKEISY